MATCTASNHMEEKVVQQLNELFGATLNFDVIKTVAVSYEYDINESCNRLLEISTQRKEAVSTRMFDVGDLSSALTQTPTPPPTPATKSKKAMDIEKAVDLINQGYKVLVILRGIPGSGKSYLARKILQSTIGFDINHRLHILSTDDFFYQNGSYAYDVRKLDAAHNENQKRAFDAMCRGFSPVIIDNTNTQMWEMKPYASMATDYGYVVQILEPDTHWSFNAKELTKRNSHDVPKVKIKEMIDRYEKNVTPEKLLSAYSLSYKLQKPPQRRLYPPPDIIAKTLETNKNNHVSKPTTPSKVKQNEIETIDLMEFDEIPTTKSSSETINKIASPWSNATNKACANVLQPTKMDMIIVSSDEEELSKSKSNADQDIERMWGVNEHSLLSWEMVTPLKDNSTPEKPPQLSFDKPAVDSNDFSCGTEKEYFELVQNERVTPGRYGTMIVLKTSNRNINQYTAPKPQTGVPKICKLDKGCMTEDVYKDYEDHISKLIGLFPAVPETHLTYWYNKCKGDLEWTIEFLLEAKEEVTTLINDDITDMKNAVETAAQPTAPNTDSDSTDSSSASKGAKPKKRRSKKDQRKSMESNELKSLIESKIDIGKEHYSDKVLKVKGFKFGSPAISTESNTIEPSTSQGNRRSPDPEDVIVIDSDIEFDEVDVNPVEEPKTPEDTIELNIGDHFVAQLENHFGDPKFPYPKGLQPVVQVPMSLARQLYTFYVESVYRQMENQNQVLDTLIQEDEEFARKLQAKEQEECIGATALPVPDLRQIMEDQQASQATYKKESEKWRNLNPDNLAVKLTRQKLFSAFPTIPQETLVEILFAHNNKYEDTVDTLLASTGAENVRGRLETIREPPIKNEVLQEMKKAQRDNCSEEYEQLQEATFYRAEASKYLKRRADLFEKAQQYFQRGMTEVAQFYSGLASLQTEYSVRANGMAASAFIDEHSKRLQDFNTLDLHYLYVKEAVPALDVFLDRSINLLRHSHVKNFEHLQIITGRGNRSENGISKIRPVVQARLKARKIQFAVLNPGLLKVKISKASMVTSELPRSR